MSPDFLNMSDNGFDGQQNDDVDDDDDGLSWFMLVFKLQVCLPMASMGAPRMISAHGNVTLPSFVISIPIL